MQFDWSPDPVKLATVFGLMPNSGNMTGRITRKFLNHQIKEGAVPLRRLTDELSTIAQIDLDLFYRPGNSAIRYWGALDLNVTRRSGSIKVFGEYEAFSSIFSRFITELGLEKTQHQLLGERVKRWEQTIDRKLFEHISGALSIGNFGSAFSSAVVYIEDRLRTKLGPKGAGLTGTELVQAAYKNPGVLSPPLSYANDANDHAHLMLRGWIGLVRNLHGHLATIPMSLEEAEAQLTGMNYILWVIENSKVRS